MLTYHFLLDLAIILLSTKVLGIITKKVHMPQVVGALLAGVILGPACLGVLYETDFIKQMAEIGVIVLMYSAGLETNINELKKCGKASFIIASFGVIIPLVVGFGVAMVFNNDGSFTQMEAKNLLENIFIGVILTATSVSITVETLRELGKLNTRSGTAILGAALIDDILGIIILTVIMSMSGASASVGIVLLKIGLFFVVASIIGVAFYYFFDQFSKGQKERRRFSVIAFAFSLFMAYIAEHYFGVAGITGAFFAGLILSRARHSKFIRRRVEITSYMLVSPIFFASIGISVSVVDMNLELILFSVVLLLAAIVTKIVGCGMGALLSKYTKKESIQIGTGMVSRGEVALIMANKGASAGLMKPFFFGPVIFTVIITTIITPVLLKFVYRDSNNNESSCEDNCCYTQQGSDRSKESV